MAAALNDTEKRIGARVRAARVALGLSQSTIGDALNLTYQQIQKYERGTNRLSVGTLQRIADKLGLPASLFLDPEHREFDDGILRPALNAIEARSAEPLSPLSDRHDRIGPEKALAETRAGLGPEERRPPRWRAREQKTRTWQRFR